MDFLISLKHGFDGKPYKQVIADEHVCLNGVRKTMLGLESMEETTADIKAINFLERVKAGNPQAIENRKTGGVMVVQVDTSLTE